MKTATYHGRVAAPARCTSDRIEDLPCGQLALLVAVVACWRVAGRAPVRWELRSVGVSAGATVTALIGKGLLTEQWVMGHRLSSTVRPTDRALEQLCDTEAVAAE